MDHKKPKVVKGIRLFTWEERKKSPQVWRRWYVRNDEGNWVQQ